MKNEIEKRLDDFVMVLPPPDLREQVLCCAKDAWRREKALEVEPWIFRHIWPIAAAFAIIFGVLLFANLKENARTQRMLFGISELDEREMVAKVEFMLEIGCDAQYSHIFVSMHEVNNKLIGLNLLRFGRLM